MTTKTQDDTEAVEAEADKQKRPFRELLARCNWIFDNPWLRAVAIAAPSPSAADLHATRNLGLSTDAGRAMRNAIRLREQYPDSWQDLLKTECNAVDVLYTFNAGPLIDTPLYGCGIKMEDTRSIGAVTVDSESWPMLLREVKAADGSWNSYDGMGLSDPCRLPWNWHYNCWPFDRFPCIGGHLQTLALHLNDSKWTVWCPAADRTHFNKPSQWQIEVSAAHAIVENLQGIPRFFKAIEVVRPTGAGGDIERIRLMIAEDILDVTRGAPAGHLTYEYVRPYDSMSLEGKSLTVSAVADFRVFQGWSVEPAWSGQSTNDLTPRIRLGAESLGRWGGKKLSISEATANLVPILERLWAEKGPIDLDNIAGLTFLENQPSSLIDLLA